MAISEASTYWESHSSHSILDCDERDLKDSGSIYSLQTPSSSSTRSGSGSFSLLDHVDHTTPTSTTAAVSLSSNAAVHSGLTTLICTRNTYVDVQAKEQLTELLRNYILYRCSLNEHCHEADFDDTALEALSRMAFLQALQTVEHFSSSVSPRIQKRSAYLMGILRGQEAHWDKFDATACTLSQRTGCFPLKGRQILNMPAQLLLVLGQCCLQGNCLPSDFTPEVCLSLHNLPLPLALKAVSAFNSNKRIVAGAKGGIINRARFFLRLIQNVAEQNIGQFQTPVQTQRSPHIQMAQHQHQHHQVLLSQRQSFANETARGSLLRSHSHSQSVASDKEVQGLCRQLSDSAVLHQTELGPIGSPVKEDVVSLKSRTSSSSGGESLDLNLEELAELDFPCTPNSKSNSNKDSFQQDRELQLQKLEQEIQLRAAREQKLLLELNKTKQRLCNLQTECVKLRSLLSVN